VVAMPHSASPAQSEGKKLSNDCMTAIRLKRRSKTTKQRKASEASATLLFCLLKITLML
jgi:hypothetical protein